MAGPICRCANGHLFESSVISLVNVRDSHISGGGEACPFPGCKADGKIIPATYTSIADAFGEFIRVSFSATESPVDAAVLADFIAAVSRSHSPPSKEALDSEFADIPVEVRQWLHELMSSVDWQLIRRFLAYLLPLLIAWKLSLDTDKKVEGVGTQVSRVQEQVDQIQKAWIDHITVPTEPGQTPIHRPPPYEGQSSRANPKGTPPRSPGKKSGKRR